MVLQKLIGNDQNDKFCYKKVLKSFIIVIKVYRSFNFTYLPTILKHKTRPVINLSREIKVKTGSEFQVGHET